MNTQLHVAIERYEKALKTLANSDFDIEQVLAVFNARDAVQKALKDENTILNSKLYKIIELDEYLRNNAERITRVINGKTAGKLKSWRESVQPSPEAWWWKLDNIAPHIWDSWDWLWISLNIAGWTANISLLLNIATRFLGGGVGLVGAAAVTLPSILALLQAGSLVTRTGQEGFDKFLEKKIPEQYHQEIKVVCTLLMSSLLVKFWLALPFISDIYNRNGLNNYAKNDYGAAEQDYLTAISLNTDNIEAHFNLGNLYEEWQDFDKAKKEYQLALPGGLPEAYNNLGRLYIKDKKYPEAASLLNDGLEFELARKNNSRPEIKYSLFKNLGWVRLEQGRNEEAQQSLQAAIGLTNNPEAVKYIKNPIAAHCLLAQVLEKQKQSIALEHWQKCAQLGSTLNPDEDSWLHIARKKIQKEAK